MSEETTVTVDQCIVQQLVNAAQLIRFRMEHSNEEEIPESDINLIMFLRDHAADEFDSDLDLLIERIIEHGGTDDDLNIILGDLLDDEEEFDEDEEIVQPTREELIRMAEGIDTPAAREYLKRVREEEVMSVEELNKLMG